MPQAQERQVQEVQDKKDDLSDDDDEKKKNKPYKKKEYHKKKNGKAYIVGDWLTDIESSSGSPMMKVIMRWRRWPLL